MTTALTTSAFAQETAEVWLVLVTIEHAELSAPIRVVNNTENITSVGNDFIAFPFDVTLPESRDDAPARGRLIIDNVTREIAEAIRTITSAPTVELAVIRAADPDTIEQSWPFFTMRNVKWNAAQVSGDLVVEDYTTEPYPAGIFSPASFGGMF